MFIVLCVKTCYMCKKVPFAEINDSPLWYPFFLVLFRFSYYYFKRVLIYSAKSACLTALNLGVIFSQNVLFTNAHFSALLVYILYR